MATRDTVTPHLTIAIDGPVASGKSTVGRIVAQELGCRFLDTGWMYRAVAHAGLSAKLDLEDQDKMTRLAERLTIKLMESKRGERLFVNGNDVTDQLHDSRVEQGVVPVAAIRGVRRLLVHQQRSIATDGSIVMVGRDIGTMVIPDATIKFYLTASPETRARRRYEERKNTPDSPSYDDVLERLVHRDKIDSQRAESHPADDAVIIDSDSLDASETARRIIDLIEGA
ncbi:MAG: (d)CMP kinase [Dehalococcoidia bacterium]|nr:(d)CMP kinase [Dehalococcoidia bacterium]